MTLAALPGWQLKALLADGETSSVEILKSVFVEIDRREAEVHAFITLCDRQALLSAAADIDRRRMRGEGIGSLAGLPISIKDNICTRDLRTTCASMMLESYLPPYDATVVSRVREADGIIIGKTNMDEFAMGGSTENSAMGITRNPRNLRYVPGGTSGGAAASIAANEAIFALGSDTGGSVRQPASFCGVVGLKPTYGSVSRYGLIAYASSFDQIGPIAQDVRDVALLFSVIAGHDPRDATSLTSSRGTVPDIADVSDDSLRLRIGVPSEFFREPLDPAVREAVEAAIALFQQEGHSVVPVQIPHAEAAVAAYYIIAVAEASSNLSRFDGVKFGYRAKSASNVGDMYDQTRSQGFGAEVKRRILLGTYVLSEGYRDAYYVAAQRARTLLIRDLERVFAQCDVIAHPVAPTPPYEIGRATEDLLLQYRGDTYTVLANLAGIPAMSLPCGQTESGLPIGIQLSARARNESTLLSAAARLETLLKQNRTVLK